MAQKTGSSILVLLIVATALVSLLPLSGCRRDTPYGKSFRFPLDSEPRQIDPQVSTDASSVALVSALFEGLTRLDENENAVPAAATWTVSDDGLQYTFRLRETYWSTLPAAEDPEEKTIWEDPIMVTAQDFVFGMQRAVAPDTGSSLASELFGIQNAREVNEGKKPVSDLGVRAVNEQELVITLTEPDPSFPEKLAGTPFMPCNEQFFEYTAGRYGLEQQYVLSNGAFTLETWNHNTSLLLRKNENYHGIDDVYPATVQYVIQEDDEAGQALLDGTLDAAALSPTQLSAAQESNLQIQTMEDTIEYIWLNNSLTCFSSSSVRCALRDALAWDLLAEQMDASYCSPAQGYIAPDALLPGSERYRHAQNSRATVTDAKKARQQLEAGLAELQLDSMPTLSVLCADDAYSMNLARYVIQSWQSNLSLYFQLEAVPADTLLTRIQVGNYQIAIGAQTGRSLYAMGALSSFLSTATFGNYARYSNSSFDKLYNELSAGAYTRADVDRLESMLVEDCPSIPLDFQKRFFGIPETCSGIVIRPFGGGAFGSEFDFRHAGKLD